MFCRPRYTAIKPKLNNDGNLQIKINKEIKNQKKNPRISIYMLQRLQQLLLLSS